jgi:site-specific recombinase XerD
MGALQERMLSTMRMRNFSERTIEAYLWHVKEFTRYFGKSPDLLNEEHVRRYLSYLFEDCKKGWTTVNVCHSALKFFYVHTLHRDWQVSKIPRPKGERRLPVVLTGEELDALFAATEKWKYRVILKTIYSVGLRLSEATHLKVHHIESSSMRIRVEQGKGKRDRYTLLSCQVLWRSCVSTGVNISRKSGFFTDLKRTALWVAVPSRSHSGTLKKSPHY